MKKKVFKESGFKQRFLKMLNKEGFYVAIFLGITLVATLLVYYTNNNLGKDLAKNDGNVSIETSENLKDSKAVNKNIEEEKNVETKKPEEEKKVEETKKPEEKKTTEPAKAKETNKATTEKATPSKATPSTDKPTTPSTGDPLKNLQNPVGSKEVVMAFSAGGSPVYSATLKEFTSDHSGVDIKSEIGKEVKAAADGKVIKIYKDNKLGQTIVIQHSNNIETRYSNLDEKVELTKNQTVKSGQIIGKVGKTASFEVDDAPHVHFEIWKDGKCVDPSEYLN